MKRCPACSRVYDNESMRFCLDDGTALVEKLADTVAPATLVLPAFPNNVPTIKEAFRPDISPIHAPQAQSADVAAAKKRNLLPWFLGIGALILVLGLGGVLAMLVFSKPSAQDLALVLRLGALPAPVKIVDKNHNK